MLCYEQERGWGMNRHSESGYKLAREYDTILIMGAEGGREDLLFTKQYIYHVILFW